MVESKKSGGRAVITVMAGLIAATVIAYEPVRHNDFVDYDDNDYVTENPHVKEGLSAKSVIWAFTHSHAANYHPLTWISHMADCELYDLRPLGHHLTNILLHIAAAVLLFLALFRMTAALWRSAFVAAAFALHPVHVESVAWLAERKDVLSGVFWMLTILAYASYARRPTGRSYTLVLACLCMGLLSKPMVVTLPFVLLLLDYWPLNRVRLDKHGSEQPAATDTGESRKYSPSQLVLEKFPFFALVAALSVITFVIQKQSQAVAPLGVWPLKARFVNSLGSYFNYVVKLLYPVDIAVLYPAPEQMRLDAALLTIMGVAVLLVLFARSRRWLTVGLFWYLGTLVPVIGLVHVGAQIMADRYTYLPSIGLFIMAAWAVAEIADKRKLPRAWLAIGAVVLFAAMILLTRRTVTYWRDSETLFTRAVTVTKNNYVMHNNLGGILSRKGRYDEAMKHFEESLRIVPEFLSAKQNICSALLEAKRLDEAIECLSAALKEDKKWPDIHMMYNDLGYAYELKGNYEPAEKNYRIALTIKPDYDRARGNLVSVLKKQGKLSMPPQGMNQPAPK